MTLRRHFPEFWGRAPNSIAFNLANRTNTGEFVTAHFPVRLTRATASDFFHVHGCERISRGVQIVDIVFQVLRGYVSILC